MGFQEAVASVLGNYAQFNGRARRSEFWWFVLFYFILAVIAGVIDRVLFGEGSTVFGGILWLALIIPSLAVSARRLHDTDRSGWLLLLNLIPIVGFLVLLYFYVQDGTPGANQHGPDPKGRAAAAPPEAAA